ncbi:carbohydrate-binding X8 domain superfamily protein [Actinidia rufa]|uniref:Carbohydrate-binding X8 domain superfamily protein n=1 Tax=Actinidia rufa TaxID=165716 RepID=A0A7J0G5W3_9ERIC|nr:carbohydrate-binding X8 domain superfamily protein [Actinidia rufa]
MGARVFRDPSIAETNPVEAIRPSQKLYNEEIPIIFSPAVAETQLDTIPIVNPTPPSTITPIIMPASPPPPPATTVPIMAPPTPTTTTPTTSSGGTWCVASPAASETALQLLTMHAAMEEQIVQRFRPEQAVIIQPLFATMHHMHSMTTTRRTQFQLAVFSEEPHSSPTLIQLHHHYTGESLQHPHGTNKLWLRTDSEPQLSRFNVAQPPAALHCDLFLPPSSKSSLDN